MKLSSSWEAASCTATFYGTSEIHYRVHKSPPLAPNLSQINTAPSYLRPILIFFTHLHLCPPSGLFPSGFPHEYCICIPLLPHSCYVPCQSYTWQRVQVMKLLIMHCAGNRLSHEDVTNGSHNMHSLSVIDRDIMGTAMWYSLCWSGIPRAVKRICISQTYSLFHSHSEYFLACIPMKGLFDITW
jgi:hypothetical protein